MYFVTMLVLSQGSQGFHKRPAT